MLRVPSTQLRLQGKRASVSKGVCGKVKEWASAAEFAVDASHEDDALSSFWKVLCAPPERRLDSELLEILRWWKKYLPLIGAELAPELQVPDHVLLELLRRSRIIACESGKKLQEEGDEVRHYAIIVAGRCRLRCSRSGGAGAKNRADRAAMAFLENITGGKVDVHNDPGDEDLVHIGEIRAGEPLGTFPGDKNVGFEAVCLERTVVLLLGKEDYENTLKHYHRDMHSQAVDFLRRHRLCTEALVNNLERLVRHFRHRVIAKGTTIIKAGDPHRHIWFLREGCCSVLMSPDSAAEVLQQQTTDTGQDVEDEDDSNEEDKDDARLAHMKASACLGAEGQQHAAAEDRRNKSIAKYARAGLRCALEGSQPHSGSYAAKDGFATSSAAMVRDPGTVLGLEALLYEQQDLLIARSSYTIKVVQDCSFYEADITMWKQLAVCFNRETLAHIVHEQLHRRAQMVGRSSKAVKKLDKRKLEFKKCELRKEERQQLRLPWNSDSFGPKDLEDIDDYLEVVFEHRRAPRDDKNKPTLSVLEGIKLGPAGGPAVNRLLKEVSENRVEKIGNKGCVSLRKDRHGSSGLKVNSGLSCNPMGECVTAAQLEKYAIPPSDLMKPVKAIPEASLTMPSELTRISSQHSGVSIFQQTELDVEVTLLQSSSVPILPRVPGRNVAECFAAERDTATATSTSVGGMDSDDLGMRPDSQVSSLFGSLGQTRPSTSGIAVASDAELPLLDTSTSTAFDLAFISDEKVQGALPRELEPKSKKKAITTKVLKAFSRAVAGRSVLVLTERPDVRKAILRSLLATELQLCFAKTQTDVWHRLQNQKDAFHALIWDLTKSQVSVTTLLTSIRQHDRYSRLPIVVLAAERELPDVVRTACNYVIFHPVSTSILREGLLWCFDRKALNGLVKLEKSVSMLVPEPLNGVHRSWADSHPPSLGWLSEEVLLPAPQAQA